MLCIGKRIKNHKPLVLESTPDHLQLYCSLRHQTPGCLWRGLLIKVGGKAELRLVPGSQHNEHSPAKIQKTGFTTVEQYLAARSALGATLVAKPNKVLFSMRLDDKVDTDSLTLKKIQNLKKQSGCESAACREDLGALATFVNQHATVPKKSRTGYFCVHNVSRDRSGNPHVTLVATTTKLQHRATENPAGTAGIDGGHGFCVHGWPMCIKGEVNGRGQLGATELIITSTMLQSHVSEAVLQAATSAEKVSKRPAKKEFTMSDAEWAFARSMQEAHDSHHLMCWFHVVQAVRGYVLTHAQLPLDSRKLLFTSKVRPDLWCLHRSLCQAEFTAKVATILQHWEACGIDKVTYHVDNNGTAHTLSSYFSRQWIKLAPNWYVGCSSSMPKITTNNAIESKVRYTRELAGGCPSGMVSLAKFMLAQVTAWSDDEWDALAERPIEKDLWQRATVFQKLFATSKVYRLNQQSEILYFCWERDSADDVAQRADTSQKQDLELFAIRRKLRSNSPVSHAELELYNSGRVFGESEGQPHCSCGGFVPWRRCLHTLAHGLMSGTLELPTEFDPTRLSKAKKGPGRPKKAGDRYSKGDAETGDSADEAAADSNKALASLGKLLVNFPDIARQEADHKQHPSSLKRPRAGGSTQAAAEACLKRPAAGGSTQAAGASLKRLAAKVETREQLQLVGEVEGGAAVALPLSDPQACPAVRIQHRMRGKQGPAAAAAASEAKATKAAPSQPVDGEAEPGPPPPPPIHSRNPGIAELPGRRLVPHPPITWGQLGEDDTFDAEEPDATGADAALARRMQEVSRRAWSGRYFEKQQPDAAKCGKHALNNICGGPLYIEQDLAAACQQVMTQTAEPRDMHWEPSGWYSHSVLGQCLQNIVPPVYRLMYRPAVAEQWDDLSGHESFYGALVNVGNWHWKAIVKHNGFVFDVDSLQVPMLMEHEDYLRVISENPSTFMVVSADFESAEERFHLEADYGLLSIQRRGLGRGF